MRRRSSATSRDRGDLAPSVSKARVIGFNSGLRSPVRLQPAAGVQCERSCSLQNDLSLACSPRPCGSGAHSGKSAIGIECQQGRTLVTIRGGESTGFRSGTCWIALGTRCRHPDLHD